MRVEHVMYRIEQQVSQSRRLSTAIENLMQGPITQHRVSVRLQAVNEQWEEFQAFHKAITLAVSRLGDDAKRAVQNHSYFSAEIYDRTYECYLETLAQMSTLSEESGSQLSRQSQERSSPQPSSSVRNHFPRLPRLDLPKFDGNLVQWIPFRDMFTSLVIENSSISPVERLQYLKTCLTGTAAQLLKNTSLTAENFPLAWEALTSFYENDRLLVTAALQSLFTIRKMSKESGVEMEALYSSMMQVYRTLEALKRPIHQWDDILVFMVIQRFDPESVKAWEHHLGSTKTPPSWNQLSNFMTTRLFSLKAFEKSVAGPAWSSQSRNHVRAHAVVASQIAGARSYELCKSSHYLTQCPEYLRKTAQLRNECVAKLNLCFNCLRRNHRVTQCSSVARCRKCGKRHHTSLHKPPSKAATDTPVSSAVQPAATTSSIETPKSVNHALSAIRNKSALVLLATAKVRALDHQKGVSSARVLLDPGSEVSLVTERLVQQLQLPRLSSRVRLLGIGQANGGRTRGFVTLILKPHFESSAEVTIKASILPKLTSATPPAAVDSSSWTHLKSLPLADPQFSEPGQIDILIGADAYGHLLEGPLIKVPRALQSPN